MEVMILSCYNPAKKLSDMWTNGENFRQVDGHTSESVSVGCQSWLERENIWTSFEFKLTATSTPVL